jgi:hypothetical protein
MSLSANLRFGLFLAFDSEHAHIFVSVGPLMQAALPGRTLSTVVHGDGACA